MDFMRRLLTFFAFLLVLAAVAGVAFVWFQREVHGPGPLAAPATVIIAPGSGLAVISHQLANAGVVRAPWMFQAEARRSGQSRALKPGEYRFDTQVSLADALKKIVDHDVVLRFVTVPEGLLTAEILRVVDAAEGLQGDLPAIAQEGVLLPETYRYEWGDRKDAVIARMRAAHAKTLDELWAARAPDLPLATPEEALILASIIEKETGVPEERARVAAVFVNRLRIGMRLQSDPTVAYGLGAAMGERELTRADLAQPTPYNTYVMSGLPPAPICNPGRASIAAALHPAETNELYFVATGTGGHAFAATLDAHNRNVAAWRKLVRSQKATE